MNNQEKLEQGEKMSRRRFLKLLSGVGVVGATGTLSGCLVKEETVAGKGWLPNQYQKPSSWPVQVRGRVPIDPDSPSLVRDDQKCILCGQCLEVCEKVQSVFGYYELPIKDDFVCVNCGQCTLWCPTSAISEKSEIQKVKDAINDPNKVVFVQTAPSTRVGLGEEFGLPAGTWVQGQQVAALRRVGFDKVFDTNFTADLTIMEEGSELVKRITNKEVTPQITSCCPGWVKFCEYYYSDLLDHLSSAKSPQQMFGAVLKTYYAKKNNVDPEKIFSVSIMPCTAKKFEKERPEFNSAGQYWKNKNIRDVDASLTTRELAVLIKENDIDLTKLPEENYDPMMGAGSGAGLIFGNTGGVMEAAVRSAYFLITEQKAPEALFKLAPIRGLEGIKEATLNVPGVGDVKVAVVHGLNNARIVMDEVRAGKSPYHFIEIMACPGGCISGGGQPRTSVPPSDEVRKQRIATMYNKDASYVLRESHENPEIKKLYQDFLEQPLSHIAHDLLHTKYTERKGNLKAKKLV
ncbi:[FeFe] hydrogenase, group A [Desulfonispora thiosulfatigenes DSM 11270]|uniref:[FeFe] hydrogenase, group A n=1 Tax=Desulfonispora thiosulfatigenes DSM 11270 TaxID=656914 RepID=A0A1W1VG95_DESTI|nr:[FeFe] hydrogenase, group A [Desulfonispora thiosulfatigenes]SMB92091.1 [FeFe] hydrogenase, group A [Desulfonispora thiosulfatigenes DSM 11270]